MSQSPPLPAIFEPLLVRFEFTYEGDESTWVGRPWLACCRGCRKAFHPLESSGAVGNMLAHRCAGEKK